MSDHPVVAIHQPNYLPWLGYFYKMEECDVFVFLDAVQFPRGQSFANRNRIKVHNGTTWLTVPVTLPDGEEGKATYNEVAFATDKWKRKHLKTLQMNYKRSPYYDEIYPLIEEQLHRHDDFVELNIGLITVCTQYLGLQTDTIRLSELPGSFGEKTQLIVDICDALDAHVYLSGTGGGKEYNDEALLQEHGIELRYSQFTHPEYPQPWGDFEPNLSIIDLLFNCGPKSRKILLGG